MFITFIRVEMLMWENRIRELRKKKGLSQQALAEAAKTSQQRIQRIESSTQQARLT
jgi:transcriptional regulator with XRE-family HTH domain